MISATTINIYEGYRLMYNYQSYHTYNFFSPHIKNPAFGTWEVCDLSRVANSF